MSSPTGGDKSTRKIVFTNFQPISLTRPAPGNVPNKMDELCLTYSFQTARGRSQNREPKTYSICLRKVYPHEVTDHLLGTEWGTRQSNKIPLPPECQPVHEQYLEEHDTSPKADQDEMRYWEQGWYLWTTSSNKDAVRKLLLMSQTLGFQHNYIQNKIRKQMEEQNEKMRIEQLRGRIRVGLDGTLNPALPPDHLQYPWQHSSLVQIPTSLRPILDPVRRLLTPTAKVLGILRRSFESGTHQDFARQLVAKALSPEPFILGRRLCKRVWEMLSGPPPDATPDT